MDTAAATSPFNGDHVRLDFAVHIAPPESPAESFRGHSQVARPTLKMLADSLKMESGSGVLAARFSMPPSKALRWKDKP